MSRIAEVLEAAGLGQDAARAAEESILKDYRSKEETDDHAHLSFAGFRVRVPYVWSFRVRLPSMQA